MTCPHCQATGCIYCTTGLEYRIKQLKRVIDEILATYPATRNSDQILHVMFLWCYFPDYVKKIEGHYYTMSPLPPDIATESQVGRIRRKIQNPNDKKSYKGKYPPTDPKVARERGWREMQWRSAMGANPELTSVIW